MKRVYIPITKHSPHRITNIIVVRRSILLVHATIRSSRISSGIFMVMQVLVVRSVKLLSACRRHQRRFGSFDPADRHVLIFQLTQQFTKSNVNVVKKQVQVILNNPD
jgi:hypothetical protein